MGKKDTLRINIKLEGEPARWFWEWRERGLVKSSVDAVLQAFRLYQERLIEFDRKREKL